MTASRKPPRPYSRHGLHALKARVMVRGLQAIDARTAGAQALLNWRAELITALGGAETISPQQLALVELATRTKLYVDHLDCWLMEQRSLVNLKRRAVLPVLRERQQLVDSLSRLLSQLGLERKAKPISDIRAYIAERYGKPAPGAPQEAPGA